MLSKFEIAAKECNETEGWLKLLFNTKSIDEDTYKSHRNLCGRIRRMLIASCKTVKSHDNRNWSANEKYLTSVWDMTKSFPILTMEQFTERYNKNA